MKYGRNIKTSKRKVKIVRCSLNKKIYRNNRKYK